MSFRLQVLIATCCCLSAKVYSEDDPKFQVAGEVIAKIAESLPDGPVVEPKKPRNILIYSKTLGFRHGSIPTGVKAFQMMGDKTRAFSAIHSEDPSMFDADKLSQFDAVVMLNVTGDCLAPKSGDLTDDEKETLEQRKRNLHDFVRNGKGILGTHSATDAFYTWKIYGDMMGGWFTGHPWHTDVPLKVDSPNHPLTAMFDAEKGFQIKDEIYQFAPRGKNSPYGEYQPYSRENLRILLSLNADEFDVAKGKRTDEDYAISWVRDYEKGRVFYSVLGHNDFIFHEPTILKHYLAGLQFVLGDLEADATPSGASKPSAIATPFNGNNLEGWRLKRPRGSHWVAGTATVDGEDPTKLKVKNEPGELVNSSGGGVDIFTDETFGDCTLEIELMVPQGSNSGIYLHGNYEVQVFDSWGKEKPTAADIGGIYGASAPRVNAAKAPGEWQKFEIEFQAPRFDGTKKTQNAIFKKVILNGQLLHENVEVAGPTGGNLGQGEAATGPLMFQGDHGAVAYRNIVLTLP